MGGTSPCASCKLLRRRCAKDCIFAPYFPPDDPHKFAIVHKVFGASNVSKMLQVPISSSPISLYMHNTYIYTTYINIVNDIIRLSLDHNISPSMQLFRIILICQNTSLVRRLSKATGLIFWNE